MSADATAPVLEVRDVRRVFSQRGRAWSRGSVIKAVDGVSFTIARGEAFGLVGESGSGKSTVARCVLRLERPDSGQIILDGLDCSRLGQRRLRATRRTVQAVFQDPAASLNPRWQVLDSVAEPLIAHGASRGEARAKAARMLDLVGLTERMSRRRPHELSGGQQQRVAIARAIGLGPKLIVADEPLSALDVSIQAQILNLMLDLKRELGLAYLFISHDLAVTQYLCETVAVFHRGRIVEMGSGRQVFRSPRHPYTAALTAAASGRGALADRDDAHPSEPRAEVVQSTGCPYADRCARVTSECQERNPELEDSAGRLVACLHPLASAVELSREKVRAWSSTSSAD